MQLDDRVKVGAARHVQRDYARQVPRRLDLEARAFRLEIELRQLKRGELPSDTGAAGAAGTDANAAGGAAHHADSSMPGAMLEAAAKADVVEDDELEAFIAQVKD